MRMIQRNREKGNSGKKGKTIFTPLADPTEPEEEDEEEEFKMIDLDNIHVFPVHLENLDEVSGWTMETGKGFPRIFKLDQITGDATILLQQQPATDEYLLQAHFKSNSDGEEALALILCTQPIKLWRLSDLAEAVLGLCPTSSPVLKEANQRTNTIFS